MHLHYTPTYSSWLNQVENWFAKIERDVIARGVFTSVKDLARKLMRYIRHYNRAPKPIKWTYRDPSQRITSIPMSLLQATRGRSVAHSRDEAIDKRVVARLLQLIREVLVDAMFDLTD